MKPMFQMLYSNILLATIVASSQKKENYFALNYFAYIYLLYT